MTEQIASTIKDLCKSSGVEPHDRRKIKEHYLHQPATEETLRKLRYDLYITADSTRGFLLCGNKECEHNHDGFDCHSPERIPDDSTEFMKDCERSELYRGMP